MASRLVPNVALLIFALSASARAQSGEAKRLVVHVESSVTQPVAVREGLKGAIPEDVVVVAPDAPAGAPSKGGPTRLAGASIGSSKHGPALWKRMHNAAADAHAEGVVVVVMSETAKRRAATIVVLYADDQTPALDREVLLDRAAAGTDATKMAAALGPALERLAGSVPPTPDAESRPSVAPEPAPITPEREPPPVAAPAPRAPVSGSLSLRVLPGGGGINVLNLRVAIPVSSSLAVIPQIGGSYAAPPVDDMAYIFGGGARLKLSSSSALLGAAAYGRFPKRVVWYTGLVSVGMAFGEQAPNTSPPVKAALTASVTRWLWEPGFGAPGSEVVEGIAQLDAQIRLLRPLVVMPNGAYFLFDRSLVGFKQTTSAVTFALAPYPIQTHFGGALGYETARLMPYVGARSFLYAADVGTGTSTWLGLVVNMEGGFVDTQVGFTFSDSKGPASNPPFDSIPYALLDMGWPF